MEIGEVGMYEAVGRTVVDTTRIPLVWHLQVDILPIQSPLDDLGIELGARPDIERSDRGRLELAVLKAVLLTTESLIEVAYQLTYLQLLSHLAHRFLHLIADTLGAQLKHATVVFILHP